VSKPRIYHVVNRKSGSQVMVKAHNQAQALRHVTHKTFRIAVATSLEVVEYMDSGLSVEDGTKEPTDLVDEANEPKNQPQ
jgi:hypothetical protein